jgi:phage terminase small subunit
LSGPTIVSGGDGLPPEPDWSGVYDDDLDVSLAHETWGHVIREMRGRDTVAIANSHQIKRYVMACVMHDSAARHVIEKGAVIKAKRSSAPQYNPWWSVMKDADARAIAHEAELGISPRRRSAASKVQRSGKKPTAADAYLKPVPRPGNDDGAA